MNKLGNKAKFLSTLFFGVAILGGCFFLFKKPKVSIVMPVYNGEKYLDQTIGFLLQSYTP